VNRRVVLALPALLALPGCSENHSWHQKLTLVVATPQGEVSGSSVVEVRVTFYDPPSFGTEVVYGLTGEATVLEVAPGKYLFALLGGSEERFYAAAKDRFKDMTRGAWLREIPKQTEPANLLPDHLPMLVTFDDIARPETVRLVDPADLAAVFGPGVSLKAVTLEVTEEAVTDGGVEGVLGWLRPLWPHMLDGQRYETIEAENRFANSINVGHFSSELGK
jgi:hypothetical protein